MTEINFKELEKMMMETMTLHQAALMKYGVGDIAHELKKSDKTIYAELNLANLMTYMETIKNYDEYNKKPGCLPKLGLVDFIIGMLKSKDLSPLVSITSFFNLGCFPLKVKNPDRAAAARALSKITQIANKECTDSFNAVVEAIAGDGIVNKVEAAKVSRECQEAINALAEVKSLADAIKA